MIGAVVNLTTRGSIAWARAGGIVKVMDNIDLFSVAPADTDRVFRHFFRQIDPTRPDATAYELLAALGGYRHPKLVCEAFFEYYERSDVYVAFMRRVVELCKDVGVGVIGPVWGSGAYNQEDWDFCRANGWFGWKGIALQAYWADAGFTSWNALRYRKFWRPGDPFLYVVEAGRDIVRDGPNGEMIGKGGWKADGLSAEQYRNELIGYNGETRKDGYVRGVCVFEAGTTRDWDNYSIDQIAPIQSARTSSSMGGKTMPDVGQGFQKCVPLIGTYDENEVYHFPGTNEETSLAVTANGYATYRKTTNETIAHHDDGRIWRDFGNHSIDGGQMHQVSQLPKA